MSNLINKENITIVIGTYTNNEGQEKKQFRTIGELITMQGDDGSHYQFGKIWGAGGCTEIKIYPQEDKNAQPQQQQQAPQQYQQPQQNHQQPSGQPMTPKQVQQQQAPQGGGQYTGK